MTTFAFVPMGNTVTFTAAASPPAAVQAPTWGPQVSAMRIINSGSVLVYMGYGANATVAASNAAAITSTGGGIPLLPGTDEILQFPPNCWFTGTSASNTAVIFLTPGEGA